MKGNSCAQGDLSLPSCPPWGASKEDTSRPAPSSAPSTQAGGVRALRDPPQCPGLTGHGGRKNSLAHQALLKHVLIELSRENRVVHDEHVGVGGRRTEQVHGLQSLRGASSHWLPRLLRVGLIVELHVSLPPARRAEA